MLQLLWSALRGQEVSAGGAGGDPWRFDPLAHPSIDRMSERELGDLPWPAFGEPGGRGEAVGARRETGRAAGAAHRRGA